MAFLGAPGGCAQQGLRARLRQATASEWAEPWGLSEEMPGVPEQQRGVWAGLRSGDVVSERDGVSLSPEHHVEETPCTSLEMSQALRANCIPLFLVAVVK